jgi:outer membrane receptor protein involved in Fe transport
MVMRNTSRALFVSAAVAALAAADGAYAQKAAPDSTQEVVVTANKRAERIQDVAMSDSAVTNAQLERTQSLDLQDIATQVAGLNLVQGGEFGYGTRLILRGLNTGGAGAEVATVVDDLPLSFSSAVSQGAFLASDFEPYDMSRIEVLRGPQGTLYGATAEGGLIKYVTTAPDTRGFHGGLEIGAQGVEKGGVAPSEKGYLNIPLFDTAALRVSGYYEELPGWISDRLDGHSRTNDLRRSGARAQFLWKPTNDLTVRLFAMYQSRKSGAPDNIEASSSFGPNRFAPLAGLNNNTYIPNYQGNNSELYGVNLEDDLHFARVQSITSYGEIHQSFGSDTPYYGNLFEPGTTLFNKSQYGLTKFNQELRIFSEDGNKLFGNNFEWQIGAFYTDESSSFSENYFLTRFPSGAVADTSFFPFPTVPGSLLFAAEPGNYKEFAGYIDGTYHFTPQLDVEVGARVFKNWQDFSQTSGGLFVGQATTPSPETKSSESDATYSFAPRFHITPDDMVYVRIASGYRPGGPEPYLPGNPAGVPLQFHSDTTINYEAGFKGSLFGNTLTADLAVFYIDWTKVQVNELVVLQGGLAGAEITVNGAKAYTDGLEWNLVWRPIQGLSLGTTGAYTKTDLKSGIPQVPGSAGEQLPYVPDVSGNINGNYEFASYGGARPFVGGTLYYVGNRYSDFVAPRAGVPNGHVELPTYTTLELYAGVRYQRYLVEVYGKNLTNERGITYYSPYGGATSLFTNGVESLIRPLTVGIRLSADF